MKVNEQNENDISVNIYSINKLGNMKRLVQLKKKNVLAYNFTETVDDLAGSFSVTLYEDLSVYNMAEQSLWSQIHTLDVVEIKEGKKLFKGIIHSKTFKNSMSNGSATRTLEISGMGIHSLFSMFNICFNTYAGSGKLQSVVQTEFSSKILNEKSLNNVINLLWDSFTKNAKESTLATTIKIENMINFLFDNGSCFDINNKYTTCYPIANSWFNSESVSFYDLLNDLFNKTYYEIYGYFQSNGKPYIKIREMPFSAADWEILELIKFNISPSNVIGYSFNISDSEVYTAFFPYVEGAGFTQSQYKTMEMTGTDGKQRHSNIYRINQDKVSEYGYRLLNVNFVGCTQDVKDDNKQEFKENLERISENLEKWYLNIDKMVNGTIQMVTDVSMAGKQPQIGNIVTFNGFEFYVKSIEHTWQYGDAPTLSVNVTRGGIYTNGEFDVKKTLNSDITKRYSELN